MRYFKEGDAVFGSRSSSQSVFSPLDTVMRVQKDINAAGWLDSDPLKAVAVAQKAFNAGLTQDPTYQAVKAWSDFQKVAPMNRNEFVRDTSSYRGGSGGAVFGFSRLEFQGWRYIPYGV